MILIDTKNQLKIPNVYKGEGKFLIKITMATIIIIIRNLCHMRKMSICQPGGVANSGNARIKTFIFY